MSPIDQLKAVLCDPEGKCCISGSDEDRAVVDLALRALEAAVPKLKQVVAVAICDLFDKYPPDVKAVFSDAELGDVADACRDLCDQRVEDIYRKAWDLFAVATEVKP